MGRDAIGIELNEKYVAMARKRIGQDFWIETEMRTALEKDA